MSKKVTGLCTADINAVTKRETGMEIHFSFTHKINLKKLQLHTALKFRDIAPNLDYLTNILKCAQSKKAVNITLT